MPEKGEAAAARDGATPIWATPDERVGHGRARRRRRWQQRQPAPIHPGPILGDGLFQRSRRSGHRRFCDLLDRRGGGLLRHACRRWPSRQRTVGSDPAGASASVSVSIYDISNPAAPRGLGSAWLPFHGICAISFYGGYVLAAEANGARQVALIDVSNLANPQVYPTGFDSLTDVALFGSDAVVCGLSAGTLNSFQAVNVANLSSLVENAATTVSAYNADTNSPLICDFDGTNAVFSDGHGLYVFGVSGGSSTASVRGP